MAPSNQVLDLLAQLVAILGGAAGQGPERAASAGGNPGRRRDLAAHVLDWVIGAGGRHHVQQRECERLRGDVGWPAALASEQAEDRPGVLVCGADQALAEDLVGQAARGPVLPGLRRRRSGAGGRAGHLSDGGGRAAGARLTVIVEQSSQTFLECLRPQIEDRGDAFLDC